MNAATETEDPMRPARTRFALALALAGLILAATACDSTDAPGPDPAVIGPDPVTPDQLIQHFQSAYESMDAPGLMSLLDPDFVTILQQSTINSFPDVGSTLDVGEEQRIHERMFSGHDVTDPYGMLVPAVTAITFEILARQGPWNISPDTDPIPNTANALYDVLVLMDRGSSRSRLKTIGSIRFYVTSRDTVIGGAVRSIYRMRGQRDLTLDQKAASEEYVAWGTVKALFR